MPATHFKVGTCIQDIITWAWVHFVKLLSVNMVSHIVGCACYTRTVYSNLWLALFSFSTKQEVLMCRNTNSVAKSVQTIQFFKKMLMFHNEI